MCSPFVCHKIFALLKHALSDRTPSIEGKDWPARWQMLLAAARHQECSPTLHPHLCVRAAAGWSPVCGRCWAVGAACTCITALNSFCSPDCMPACVGDLLLNFILTNILSLQQIMYFLTISEVSICNGYICNETQWLQNHDCNILCSKLFPNYTKVVGT